MNIYYKLSLLFICLALISLIMGFCLQEIWQSPYVKNNEMEWRGAKYKLIPPYIFPFELKEIPSEKYHPFMEVFIKDYRYKAWINWFKRRN